MTLPDPPSISPELIGFGLFFLSELVGMSKARDNSLLLLVLHMAQELFPFEIHKKQPPSRSNRPPLKTNRDPRGRFTSTPPRGKQNR
jgi:hypothetical protein